MAAPPHWRANPTGEVGLCLPPPPPRAFWFLGWFGILTPAPGLQGWSAGAAYLPREDGFGAFQE